MHLAPGLRQFKATLTQHSEALSAPLCVYVLSDSGRIPSLTYKVLPHALYLHRPPLNGGKTCKTDLKKQRSFAISACASSHVTVRVIWRIYITPCRKNIWALLLHSWAGYSRGHVDIITLFLRNNRSYFSSCTFSEIILTLSYRSRLVQIMERGSSRAQKLPADMRLTQASDM